MPEPCTHITRADALRTGHARLGNGSSGRLEAEVLLLAACQCSREQLWARPDTAIDNDQWRRYQSMVDARQQGTPIAYLTGQQEFWSLTLSVNRATLIPRPETELLVERVLARIPENGSLTIADLGCGCGAIAAAIATERPQSRLLATDISTAALDIARENFSRLGCTKITLRQGSWYDALDRKVDLIVSNPPYVAANDPHLATGDLRFEPALALSAGADGLRDLTTLIAGARQYLSRDGRLLLEHGYDQAAAVQHLGACHGLRFVDVYLDLAGHERVSEFTA